MENRKGRVSRKADLEKRRQLAGKLRNYRLARNMSQEHLAQLIGTSVFSVSRWERAKHHPPQTTIKLMKLMGIL